MSKLMLSRFGAKRRGVEVFTGVALGDNRRVLGLLRSVFDRVETIVEDGSYVLRMPLRTSGTDRGCRGRTRVLRHDAEEIPAGVV